VVWRGKKSGSQVILDLINVAWRKEVPEAAIQGHADAQFEYAALHIREPKPGGLIEIGRWLMESLKQEYRESAAANNVGVLLTYTDDERGAAEWFELSIDLGNTVALYNRGLLGMVGREVREPFYRKVHEWFLKSAERGFNMAQGMVGILYALGKGVPQNFDKAREWMCRATRDDSIGENVLAWELSTFPDDQYGIRDGQVAVTIAERLVSSYASNSNLYTLAAAYAEAERFEDAIKTIKKLRLKLQRGRPSKDRNAQLKECEHCLTNYMVKKPLRDAKLKRHYDFWWDLR
jgi:TPR repeat protein